MPRATHSPLMRRPAKWKLIPLYASVLLLIFHSSAVMFINSSFLGQFVETAEVGTIFTISAALSVFLLLFISRVLRRVGNFKLTLLLLAINFIALLGMAYGESFRIVVPLFIIHNLILPLIFFNLDVFIEEQIGEDETKTGTSRGLLLTLSSFVAGIAPFTSSLFITEGPYAFSMVYVLAAAVLIPVGLLLFFDFKSFRDPAYNEIDILKAVQTFWEKQNLKLVFLANFALQLFFVFAVIYIPLYLTKEIGLSWTDFGIIMFCAQMAYVLFEYPVGILADKYIGEKEMMAAGFMIITLSISTFAFITSDSLLVWCIIMFISRVGAALVESTTESYFFKKTQGGDAQAISFFRAGRPLSYVLGALGASFVLLYLPFNLLFVVCAMLMIPAMFFAIALQDTK